MIIVGAMSLASLAYFAWSMVSEFLIRPKAPLELTCAEYLRALDPRWIKLTGCVLDTERMVLESDAGDFEPFSNRVKGMSSKLYATTPTWVAAWAPMRAPGTPPVTRVLYRLSTPDLMKWLNAFERGDEAQRAKWMENPVQLRRVETPGLLSGQVKKPENPGVRMAFGTSATNSLLVMIPGTWPGPELPVLGVIAGLLGLFGAAFAFRSATRSPRLDDATAEQLAHTMSTADVKLEIGELEALRREERQNSRGK
jgi:hypothetical protein